MRRRSMILAAVLAALLVLPAGMASAHDKGPHREAAVTEEATGLPADIAGTYTWSGDLFALGVTTTVTYAVELDEDGIPSITSIAVDEDTLPEGASAKVWGPGSAVWQRTPDDGDPILKFVSRAGVAVELDGERAGVLVKLKGALGDDPSATLRSIAIAAPAVEEEEPEEEPVVVIDEPDDEPADDDKGSDDERGDRDKRRDKGEGDRWKDRGDRHGHDVGWDGDRWDDDDDRRSGKGDWRDDCDPEDRDGDDRDDRKDRDRGEDDGRNGDDDNGQDEESDGESDGEEGDELGGDDSSDEEDQEL